MSKKENGSKKNSYKKQLNNPQTQRPVSSAQEEQRDGQEETGGKKGIVKNLLIMVGFVLLFLLVVYLIKSFAEGGTKTSSSEASSIISSLASSDEQNSTSDATSGDTEEGAQPQVTEQDWNTIGPLLQTNNTTLTAPDYRMIALPENGRVDISYFNDTTFIGDSITQGFSLYTKSLPAKYCAYKNISPKGIYDGSAWENQNKETEVPLDAIVASNPQKVYILIGANALGGTTDEAFIQYYTEMLNQIKNRLGPNVQYYIQSITPVRPDSKFDQNRINQINDLLAQLAYQQDMHFVNLVEVLAGDDGYLREEYAGYDGIHMLEPGYTAWIDYLVTHTAYNPQNPYLEGSPAYTAAA